jgi:DNA repair protein RadC
MAGNQESKKPIGLAEPAPHFHGHRERLRERFLKGGSDALADYELLELVLFRGIGRRDVKPLAKDLLKQFGSFAEVVSAPIERLKSIRGLGEAAITELKISLIIGYGSAGCYFVNYFNGLFATSAPETLSTLP